MNHTRAMILVAAILGGAGCAAKPAQPHQPKSPEQTAAGRTEASRLFDLGRKAQEAKDMAQAETHYRAAIAASPEFGAAWNNLGTVLLAQEKYLDAADTFRIAAEKSPTDPRPLENLAYVYSVRGWTGEALRYYVAALERSPNRLSALRGAVAQGQALNVSTEDALERARMGMLIETDEAWRGVFQRETIRIERDLAERDKRPNTAS
ncbi:MAG: tetratricopeptide repeat protein [Phycisphaerales bacterium]|jgi:tetratricopeptide (TPR) repeat protein|nr:tetratricopeptide repeat protein [Phycisphaerales bacterium]